MKAELIPMDGSPPIRILKDVTVVGRREYCDVRIDDPSLSKRHCILVKTDGLLVIRDLATTNGTKVKGQKIRWAALLPDDRIALGSIKFKVYLGPDDLPSPSEGGAMGEPAKSAPANGRPSRSASPGPKPAASRALAAPKADPGPRRPLSEFDLPPLDLDGQGWMDAANAGIAAEDDEDDEDDLIIDLD